MKRKSLSVILSVIAILLASCSNWMKDDNLYSDIENDVKVANAANVSVYVRYANSKMGTTEPSGYTTLKVDIPADISAVTSDDYGFVRWVAFSTEKFSTSKQHSDLFYDSAEKYARDYQPLELPSSEVAFEDPTSPSTKVTINTTRSDIFITPLVAKRPTVVTSVPSNGRADVVRNSQVRILFSKPIDESTLKDEFGNSNIVITSGSAVLTETSGDLSAKDITDNFKITLGKTKKMLTIAPKSGFYFDNNSQISINIYEDVCDTDGYGMNGKYSFSFTTGVKLDSLAPRIEKLWASTGDDFTNEANLFEQYGYQKESATDFVYKTYIDAAPTTLNNYVTGDASLTEHPILKQRVKDYLNIYVQANDIAGSGANVTVDSNTLSESDVALVQVRATLYVNASGTSVTTSALAFADNSTVSSDYYIPVKDIGYAPGLKDSDCRIQNTFEGVMGNNVSNGTLFTYDLRSLPDGLIKIDIWAVDMVGNSGETEQYALDKYNNNYRSIFVVKDSTAPDAATEKAKLQISSTNVPYGWYNSTALSSMKIQDKKDNQTTNLIKDLNNVSLSSDMNDLMWAFKLGNDPNWKPSASDTNIWSNIHDGNGAPVEKAMSDATVSSDGPVYITMCLKDDLGNVSDSVVLDAINYDNTAPVVSATVGWVKPKAANTPHDYEGVVATTNVSNLGTNHILKIPFTEQWAGLKRIKVNVYKQLPNGPFSTIKSTAQDGYSVYYVPESGTARDLAFGTDISAEEKVFDVTDSNKLTTGTLYISGIKLAPDTETNLTGKYRVDVDICDSSLNWTNTIKTEISIDTTPPVLKRVYIPELKHSINATSSGVANASQDGWFLSREHISDSSGQSYYSSVTPGYIPLYLFVKEKDSGIHKISFASTDSVALFNTDTKKTTLYKIENFGEANQTETLIPASDYTISTTAKTITLVNNPSVKLSSASEQFVILVKDIGFKSVTDAENTIRVTVEDLATLQDDNIDDDEEDKAWIYPHATGTTKITGVKCDSFLNSTLPDYTLKDMGHASSCAAQTGYTNEDKITITVSLGADDGSSAKSGYNKFKLSGAKFTSATQVYIGNQTSQALTYQLSDNNTVLTLRKMEGTDWTDDYIVVRNQTINFKNVQFDNNEQGRKAVSITAYDLAGWDHPSVEKTIIFDAERPVLLKGPFTADYTNSEASYYKPSSNVYPHPDGENATGEVVNLTINGSTVSVPHFYTATTWRSGASTSVGTVSLDDSTPASVVLGIRATDNIELYGTTTNTTTFLKYYKHVTTGTNPDTFANVTTQKVVDSGTFATSTSSNITSLWAPSANGNNPNTIKNSVFDIGFDEGNYSFIIVDKAGNTSNVFHFRVVKDVEKPSVSGLNDHVLVESPSGSLVYRNQNSVDINKNEIQYQAYGYTYQADSISIKTIRYVTRKTGSDKYKIILNLGNTNYTKSASAEKLTKIHEDTDVTGDTKANYAELSASTTTSPIEQYAISTWYGSWPVNNNTVYTPVPPYGTVFPDGTVQNTSSVNDDGNVADMVCHYFDGDAAFSSNWRIRNNSASWHNWNDSAHHTDKGEQTDATATNDDVISYVENNNLIIEIPQYNTAPISVFLRDGCGNMNYVVLGVRTSGGVQYAPSFILDDHLGYAQTDANGEVITPIIMQNPYMTSGGSGFTWDGVSYAWNKQSGNADQDNNNGVNGVLGFIKDQKKFATYYNPGINSSQNVKLGLILRFGSVYNTKTNPETVTFSTGGKASASDVAAQKYTARALLYCTPAGTAKPGKSTILAALTDENKNKGIITDWTYVQATSDATQTVMLLDYPKPDYSQLPSTWTIKNTIGEPVPYYIWYLYEDRLGNYEIAKVVNSKATGNQLKEITSGMYDKWFYDNEGPVIKIRGTDTKPNTVESEQTAVESLVAENNGYVPYLKSSTNTVYVSTSADHKVRATTLKSNRAVGTGTTRYIEGTSKEEAVDEKNSSYLPFFDLEVSERTGVRAFCWSTSEDSPASDSAYTLYTSTGSKQSGIGYWNPGYMSYSLTADIGSDFTYSYGSSQDTANAYFSFTDSSVSSYTGVYSGTKVNTVIPYDVLSNTYARTLYLHVMDWVGNVSSYKMGNNLLFLNDTAEPVISTGSYAGQSVPNQYYLIKESGEDPVLRIAGMGTYAAGSHPIQVYLPAIDDNSTGAGILGYSFENLNPSTAKADDHGAYLNIPAVTYNTFGDGKTVTYYVYDKVGNISSGTLTGIFDATPPELTNVTVNVSSGYKMYASGGTGIVTSKEYSGYSRFYENTTEDPLPAEKQNIIYVNANNVVSFNVNISAASVSDLASIKIYQWDNGWQEKATGTGSSTSYTISSTNISYSTSGTIFQILATDQSGNTSCQYFKLYLDNEAPTFDGQPTVSISKGSVNKISDSTSYAYTSDANNPMKIKFKVKDAGVGTIKNTFEYQIDGGTWESFTNTTKELSFTETASVEEIKIRDIFGNTSTTFPGFTYTAGSKTANDITKLVRYTATVADPDMEKISVMTRASWTEYQNTYYKKHDDDKMIVFKSRDSYGIQLTFDTTDLSNIMGYIDSTYLSTKDAYSLLDLAATDSIVKKVFTYEELPMEPNYVDVYKTYYAIDYAGNVSSSSLTIKFTYNNPEAAQDIEFVPADSTIISGNANLQAALTQKGITLAPTYLSGDTLYYQKNGYVLIRCTLKEAGTGTYTENPKVVTLYNKSTGTNAHGSFTTDGNTLTRINLGEKVNPSASDSRYYCYLIFKIGDDQNGRKLHCVIEGGDSKTDKLPLYSSTGAAITWTQDTANPEIGSDYYDTGDNVKKLKNYTFSNNSVVAVEDSYIGYWQGGYKSISYPTGTKVKFPKAAFTDNSSKIAEYKLVTTSVQKNSTDTNYSATSNASTNATNGNYDSGWVAFDNTNYDGTNYTIALPDITDPHRHIAIYLRDSVGNISEAYYLGHPDHSDWQWWIVDKTVLKTDVTAVARVGNTNEFSISIPAGTIIKKLEATGGATITGVTINGYKKKSDSEPNGYQPGYDATSHKLTSYNSAVTGWIVVKDDVNSTPSFTPGFKVTLSLPEASWTADTVIRIKINDVEIDTEGKELLTIPKKTLTASDIELGTATGTATAGEYTISATIPTGAKDRISENPVVTGTNITGVSAEWNSDKSAITISGATSIWDGNRTIGLTIKTSDGNFDKGTVLTVGGKTINGNGYALGTYSSGKVAVTFTDDSTPATIINATGHVLKANGTAVSGASVTYSSDNKEFTISGMPTPIWTDAQSITIEVHTSDGNFDNGGVISTIAKRTIEPNDVTITDLTPGSLSDDTTSVTFKLTKSDDTFSITSVSLSEGSDKVNLSGPESGVYTLSGKGEGGKIPTDVTVKLSVVINNETIIKPLYVNGEVQQNRISATSAFSGLIDTSKLAGTRDLAATQISTVPGRGIIMNKDLSATYTTGEASGLTRAAKKAAKKAAKQAKAAAKAAKVSKSNSKAVEETPVVQEIVSQIEDLGITDAFVDSVVLEDLPVSEQIIKEDISQVTAKTDFVMSPVEKVEIADSTESDTTSVAKEEKSSSTAALIVIMLAILSAAAGTWYLRKGRIKQ